MSIDEKKLTDEAEPQSDDATEPEAKSDVAAPEFEAVADADPDPGSVDPEPQSEPDSEPATEPTPVPRKRSLLGLIGWVILFGLILGLGIAAYYWQQNVYNNDLASLREQLAAISGAQSNVSGQIEIAVADVASTAQSAATGVDALRVKLESQVAKQGDLARSVSALYEKETQTSVDWVLAEAEYLILAATQRLALERDVDTAVAALRAADQRLRSAEHPDLIPIRDKIIADVTALEAVHLPDVEGLAIYIGKTIDQVDSLPTKPIAEELTPFATVRSGEYAAEDWRKLGYAIWSDLVELVEVKDAELPDGVLFDPELRYFLR